MLALIPTLALIPYFEIPVWKLGPIELDSWALLVSLGFILGLEIVRARAIKLDLDVRDIIDGIVVTVGLGFVGGHLMHVLAYHPEKLEKDGVMALVRVWEGFSSTGGFLGAVAGSLLFYKVLRKRPFWPHADTITFGFPFAWTLGRLGCFSAHDHIGQKTSFFLGVDFPERYYGGPRHDLGLYEALWTAVIALVFFLQRDRRVKFGHFTSLWCFLYAPARFGLDFLRNTDLENADVRWLHLTPAQWVMIGMVGAGVAIRAWMRTQPEPAAAPSPSPADPPAPPAAPGDPS
jgi:phosphatidylglycerol:prolipoprotein diacylglycerol transferase